jgi:hypothetical protein
VRRGWGSETRAGVGLDGLGGGEDFFLRLGHGVQFSGIRVHPEDDWGPVFGGVAGGVFLATRGGAVWKSAIFLRNGPSRRSTL